jgi:hypothetical protein
MVSWFWMQFIRSTILKYRLLAAPQRIGVAIRITSAQCTSASYTPVHLVVGSIWVMEHGQVQARADFE